MKYSVDRCVVVYNLKLLNFEISGCFWKVFLNKISVLFLIFYFFFYNNSSDWLILYFYFLYICLIKSLLFYWCECVCIYVYEWVVKGKIK